MKFLPLYLMFLFYILEINVTAADQRPVIILFSDDNPRYKIPAKSYSAKVNKKVLIYNLHGDSKTAPDIMKEIIKQRPALIFALGAKAAYFSKVSTTEHQDIPVLFVMVYNYQNYKLIESQHNIAGIAGDVSPGTQLFNVSMFSPNIKRVGVVFKKKYSTVTINKARIVSKIIGLNLISEPIQDNKEFKHNWLKMAKTIDVYWILNDPKLYTVETIRWVNEHCIKYKLLCIGQSENLANLGILLSIKCDLVSLGDQAASLTKDILDKNISPVNIGLKEPMGTRLVLNASTAKAMGVTFSSTTLESVHEVIEN